MHISRLLQRASMSSRDTQYFLAKLIKISLNVNAQFYSSETVAFIWKQIQDKIFIPSYFFQKVYLAVVQTSSSYMRKLPTELGGEGGGGDEVFSVNVHQLFNLGWNGFKCVQDCIMTSC